MKYYIKQSVIPLIYLFFTAITAFGILCIEGQNMEWLKILLLILNIGLYLLVITAASYKDGQDALKVRVRNDLERIQLIKTGDCLPLKIHEEYKPWKGFVFGAITCVPLVVLLIAHTITILVAGETFVGFGAVAGFLYMITFAFTRIGVVSTPDAVAVVDPYAYYWALLSIPLIVLATGLPYIIGAKKIERQQERIKEKQRSIYGE